MDTKKQWKGLAALATDAVVHGASAIERVHLAVASRPFDVLEQVPLVSAPASVVRTIHDLSTRASYASVRAVTRIVGKAIDVAIDVGAREQEHEHEHAVPTGDRARPVSGSSTCEAR